MSATPSLAPRRGDWSAAPEHCAPEHCALEHCALEHCALERCALERDARVRRGFTLIELIVVITILGILAAVVFPSLEGFSPRYRLRAAARIVGSQIGWTRSMAGGTGKEYYLRYDLEDGTFWAVLPPGEDEDPEIDVEDRVALEKLNLPDHIRFAEILYPDGDTEEGAGIADVRFDAYGNEGSHIVVLENEDETRIWIKFSSLIGSVDYFAVETGFESF